MLWIQTSHLCCYGSTPHISVAMDLDFTSVAMEPDLTSLLLWIQTSHLCCYGSGPYVCYCGTRPHVQGSRPHAENQDIFSTRSRSGSHNRPRGSCLASDTVNLDAQQQRLRNRSDRTGPDPTSTAAPGFPPPTRGISASRGNSAFTHRRPISVTDGSTPCCSAEEASFKTTMLFMPQQCGSFEPRPESQSWREISETARLDGATARSD